MHRGVKRWERQVGGFGELLTPLRFDDLKKKSFITTAALMSTHLFVK